jgi:integrase
MDGLFRRGGIWWARLVVPERLRVLTGRREFTKTTGAHDKPIGKLVAAALLADWRRQLFYLERTQVEDATLLKLVDGAPALAAGGYVTLAAASDMTGFRIDDLVRAAGTGRLSLHCVVGASASAGYLVPESALSAIYPEVGRRGGIEIPAPGAMPHEAQAVALRGSTLRLCDPVETTGAILAEGLEAVDLVALEAPARPGWLFAPNEPLRVPVGELVVPALELEALRAMVAAQVLPERVESARAARSAAVAGKTIPGGKWAEMPFSEAVEAYCTRADGLAQSLASKHERRQRMAGMSLLSEFLGDLPIGEIDADRLREFRGCLRDVPDHANRLKGGERGGTMSETIAILRASRPDYKRMTDAQRSERMQWLARLFAWLRKNKYIGSDPALVLRGESGLTRAERIESERDGDDEPGRRPFTDAELRRLFSLPHFVSGNGKHVTRRNERWRPFEYWLPLVALYGGLRLGEISQLHLADVVEQDGTWCFDINRRSVDKSLKTRASTRTVPIHRKLVQLGFTEYCAGLKAAGYRRVFPELRYASGPARYSKEAGRVMTKTLRGLGLPEDVTYHSLRHNNNSALQRAAGEWADPMLRTFIRYRVVGHELPDDVNLAHYSSTTVTELAKLVNGASFSLPEVARFDIDHALWRLQQYLPKGAADEDMGPA